MGSGALWLALWLAAAPAPREHASFLFLLQGTPVGTVELAREGGAFRYTSTHWMHAGAPTRERRQSALLPLGKNHPLPEALWLWRKPSTGSQAVVDELTGRVGTGVVLPGAPGEPAVQGELLGAHFVATYDTHETLESLRVGSAQFLKLTVPPVPRPPPDFLGGSVAVQGAEGPLVLVPPEAAVPPRTLPLWDENAALQLAEQVHARMASPLALKSGPSPECADFAEAFVKAASGHAEVVRGFYAAPGAPRAQAHAWVRTWTPSGPLELDPTLEVPVTRITHLALRDAGPSYLSLFEGRARLTRKE